MERLRKGNDIDILWEIVAGGSGSDIPYDLTGKNLEVFMSNTYEKVAIKDFKVEGNTLRWTYLGKDQQRRGIYSLLLIENNGKDGMHTVDECKAFELVDCSCMEGGEAESHVRIETIRLKSGISVNRIVPDKTLDANSGNVVENAAVAKEFQRVDKDINTVAEAIEIQGKELTDLGEVVAEHGEALEMLNGDGEGSVKKAVADGIAEVVAKAPDDFDTLKEIADYIASDKTGAAQINNTLDAHGKAISAIEKKNTEQDTAIGKKAEQDGVYPDMTVGLAEDLGGRPYYDEAEFSFRASAGSDTSIKDGMASIKELRGNAVVWNQLIPDPIIVHTNDVTVAFNEGTRIIEGHHYLYFASILGDIDSISASVFTNVNGQNTSVVILYKSTGRPYAFFTANIGCVADGTNQSKEGNVWQYYNMSGNSNASVTSVRLIDLTLMFGAGNEPVTIEEFYARMPIGVDMNAYNEGELIPFCGDAIKSVGDNAFNGEYAKVIGGEEYYFGGTYTTLQYSETYDGEKEDITLSDSKYTPTRGGYVFASGSDIMISLVHSGWKQDTDAKYQPYWDDTLLIDQRIKDAFPEGLQKWDKVYNKNGKGYIVKGTGKVDDLGALSWGTGFNCIMNDYLVGRVIPTSQPGYAPIICPTFATLYSADEYSRGVRLIYGGAGYAYNDRLVFTDLSLSTDSLIASLQGVPLYYELATPEVIEYDEPFNLDYRVADFGTEEVISDQPSAPIAAEIQYNFNANDTIRTNRIAIRDMYREIAELRAMISAMQVQLTDKEDQV